MGKNLAIDIAALIVYVVVSLPSCTGIVFHEWASVGLFILFLIHCVAHYDWVIDVAKGCRGGFSWVRQGNLLLDMIVLAVFMLVMVSGLGISGVILPSLGLVSFGYYVWGPLHSLCAKMLFALLLIHCVAHWRWVAKCVFGKDRGMMKGNSGKRG